jgi:hypothetical protein
MSNKFTVLLAATAGLAGGFLSRYLLPSPVYAQPPTVQQEVRAQKFVLVDEGGVPRGAFGIETDGTVQIEVTDQKGKFWIYRNFPAKFTWNGATISDRPKVLSLLR